MLPCRGNEPRQPACEQVCAPLVMQDGRELGEGDADGDAGLDDEIVREFHFGGGFVPKTAQEGATADGSEGGAPERRRSKKEVGDPLHLPCSPGSTPVQDEVTSADPITAGELGVERGCRPAGALACGEEPQTWAAADREDCWSSTVWLLLLQVMEEVMARSKAFKAAKSQQREEDLTATEALDTDFQVMLPGSRI